VGQKLQQVHIFILQQIKAGHVEPSNSPWNSPIFIIEKKAKGKHRLIHDLRAIKKAMQTMGTLQPGLPSPAMIPAGFATIIIDLKVCFFLLSHYMTMTRRNLPLHCHPLIMKNQLNGINGKYYLKA
jgi:hypothetical protein